MQYEYKAIKPRKEWVWQTEDKKDDQEITVHSLVAGDVLCRYWSDVEESKEARLIEKAPELLKLLKELKCGGDINYYDVRGLLNYIEGDKNEI
jgi:hypothetical protein